MLYQTGLQIVLAIVSIIMIVTFIRPQFTQLAERQSELIELADALEKINQYNTLLRQRMAEVDRFSQADLDRLETFLPTEVDPARVASDIVTIVEQNNLVLQEVTFAEAADVIVLDGGQVNRETADPTERTTGVGFSSLESEAARERTTQRFTVSVLGSYEALLGALRDFERNAYPLHLVTLSFSSEPNSVVTQYRLEFDTFAFAR